MQPRSKDIPFSESEFANFRELILQQAGICLNESKKELVATRLLKRLRHLGLKSYQDYYNLLVKLDGDSEEMVEMVNRITTNKTHFFREEHHFDFLKNECFPAIEAAARLSGNKKLRIWSAACSTGEEPYSIAMVCKEYFDLKSGWDIKILASDIDSSVLKKAEAGIYDERKIEEVGTSRIKRFFSMENLGGVCKYTASPGLRELIAFRKINFIETPWPINAKFDVILCRNVLIYFNAEVQDQLIRHFSDFLNPNGKLIIGHSESLSRSKQFFRSLGKTIYELVEPAGETKVVQAAPTSTSSSPNGQSESKQKSARVFTPPIPKAQISGRPQAVSRESFASRLDPNIPHTKIIVGQFLASQEPRCLITLLGSCVSACLWDPVAKVGGMNHFNLPDNAESVVGSPTLGVHAMELLINQIMILGGKRNCLEAKIFGGAKVANQLSGDRKIGQKNIEFITNFLEIENIPVRGQHLGGEQGRKVAFYTHSGKAFIECLDSILPAAVADSNRQPAVAEMEYELF